MQIGHMAHVAHAPTLHMPYVACRLRDRSVDWHVPTGPVPARRALGVFPNRSTCPGIAFSNRA